MSSDSKKEKDLNTQLKKLYITNKDNIISWLDKLKTYNSSDGKIPGLLNNSKIQIITESEDGTYNLILKWIKENKDKFADYNFTGIPDSAFISLSDNSVSSIKTFKNVEDVERWIINPKVNPINGSILNPMGDKYYDFYFKAFTIMRKTISFREIYYKFPKVHLLFGELDFNYFRCCKLFLDDDECDRLYIDIIKNPKELYLCNLLSENIENTQEKTTILETEIELLRNRFSTLIISQQNSVSNNYIIKNLFDRYRCEIITLFNTRDYISKYKYSDIIDELYKDIRYINMLKSQDINNLNALTYFFDFIKNQKMNNAETILNFLKKNKNVPIHTNWINDALKLYELNDSIITDIDKCFDPESGIIENYEDKKLLPIKDPLEDYFEDFENKLIDIKNPIYSQLIDLSTFKPKDIKFYLNDKEYSKFKKIKDKYEEDRKNYEDVLKNYENLGRNSSGPKPPEKPIFELSNGKKHVIGKELDPIYIKDEVIDSFKNVYNNAFSTIEEYNKIKNLPFLKLKKYFANSHSSSSSSSSSSSDSKKLIKDNELLHMTKQEIADNLLYDYSGLADKCSETIDILTNEELDDENYPLAKLQLMVRLKVYIPGTEKYRTECIYAPKLFNYLIKCINNKENFINPVTKSKYTDKHIEELMKVIRLIAPKIEKPVFIKHRNDTLLKINFKIIECDADEANLHASFGNGIIRFNNIYLYRTIGGVKYSIFNICTIPADIEISGDFGTGSSDLTSNTMLFRIYKLFNEGKLLHNYIPPYNVPSMNGGYLYIKPLIHFNRYKEVNNWFFDNGIKRTKQSFIEMFKHYAEEINNYTL
jgi:hypothetical protein